MPRQKTLLNPQEQWLRTVEHAAMMQYTWRAQLVFSKHGEPAPSSKQLRMQWLAQREVQNETPKSIGKMLWFYRNTHKYILPGDVLFLTGNNGMNSRFGMTGVTSKGVRLSNYYLAVRPYGFNTVSFPAEIENKRCDDSQVLEFILHKRADDPYVRRRNFAKDDTTKPYQAPGVFDEHGLRIDGVYISRQLYPRHVRHESERQFLRFMPDGQVWVGGALYILMGQAAHQDTVRATVVWSGNQLEFELQRRGAVVARYSGCLRDGRLHLTETGCSTYWGFKRREHVFTHKPWDMDDLRHLGRRS